MTSKNSTPSASNFLRSPEKKSSTKLTIFPRTLIDLLHKPKCSGDGRCYELYGPTDKEGNQYLWRKKKGTNCSCKLFKCRRCGIGVPKCWIELFEWSYCGYKCMFNWY